jgi:hypothetical protein
MMIDFLIIVWVEGRCEDHRRYFSAIEVLCNQAHRIRGEGSVTKNVVIIIILLTM